MIVLVVVASGCIGDKPETGKNENKSERSEEVGKRNKSDETPSLGDSLPEGYTEEDVNWISNCQDLQNMNEDLNSVYALKSDIYCSKTGNWNSGKGFEPIGSYNSSFTGIFLGQGHIITNLYIDRPERYAVGPFGAVSDKTIIKNVGFVDVEITGNNEVGGIIGDNGGVLSYSYATGLIKGNNGIGGLVGLNTGKVSMSYASGQVKGKEMWAVGGLKEGIVARWSILFPQVA